MSQLNKKELEETQEILKKLKNCKNKFIEDAKSASENHLIAITVGFLDE